MDNEVSRKEVTEKIRKSRESEYEHSYRGGYCNDRAIAEALLAIAESNLQIANAINNQTKKLETLIGSEK
jgi:hypothetical protein